ncbi:MAG TPA: FeoB small GTPase domain-containing protein [Candidatus Hydrogenedentes bacterium]|nr:FeoB small GTPase domain-containing protein [Candidatus Hydrogenedentota bacterium]
MIDVAHSQGLHVDPHRLATCLGCPVVPLVATRADGIRALVEAICAELQTSQPPPARCRPRAQIAAACRTRFPGHWTPPA